MPMLGAKIMCFLARDRNITNHHKTSRKDLSISLSLRLRGFFVICLAYLFVFPLPIIAGPNLGGLTDDQSEITSQNSICEWD